MKKILVAVILVLTLINTANAEEDNREIQSYKTFKIVEKAGYGDYMITSGSKQYIISLSYGCSYLSKNDYIYIDTFLSPGYGDLVYDEYNNSCEINNFPLSYNFNKFLVTEKSSNTSSYIIGYTYSSGVYWKYLIEYGYGCSSYNFNLNDIIYFDSYSSVPAYLDKLYIFNNNEKSCYITDVSPLGYLNVDPGYNDTNSNDSEEDNNDDKNSSDTEKEYKLSIAKFQPNPPGNDKQNLKKEYIVLKNVSGKTLNTRKWKIITKKNDTYYILPKMKLGKNKKIRIVTGKGKDKLTGNPKKYFFERKKPFFKNKHDVIRVKNKNNKTILKYEY